jgi:hypothetical protein
MKTSSYRHSVRSRLGIEQLEAREVPSASVSSAFSLDAHWAKDISADAAGNTYVSGLFYDTVDFDPLDSDPLTNPAAILTAPAGGSGYVAKYDAVTGACLWAAMVGGDNEAVAIDSARGHVFVTGIAGDDGFVAMLDDADGTVQWLQTFGGPYGFDAGYGVAVDPATGDAVVSGRLNLTPGSLNNNFDIYVARFDATADAGGGNAPVWVKQIGGSGMDSGSSVAIGAGGAVIVVGNYSGTVDFDSGPGSQVLRNGGAFVLKLTSGGAFGWVDDLKGGSFSGARADDVATDSQGNIYVTGAFYGTVDFDPGKGKRNLTSAGGDDVFALKLTPTGALAWANRMGGTDNDNYWETSAIAVDAHDNAYITGHFYSGTSGAQFGNYTLQSAGNVDVFVAKLSGATGAVEWAYAMGGAGLDRGQGVAVDGEGNVSVAGLYQGPAFFDPYELDEPDSTFVIKLTQDSW